METNLAIAPPALLPGKARHTGGLWAHRDVSNAPSLTRSTFVQLARSSLLPCAASQCNTQADVHFGQKSLTKTLALVL